METMVSIKNLRKNYGVKEAVRGIDLTIQKGELFAFLGANGAGKTSTLKMIVGVLKPDSGTITIGNANMVTENRRAKSMLSFVPDVPYVYEKLTPWEMLRFNGKLYNLDSKKIQAYGEELLKFFSLWEVRDHLIEEFSHGMRQKVVLAAALLHDPSLFVLDEPMVGLDPISIRNFKDFLKKKTRQGMTVIFSTHTLSTAEEMADRIGIIDHGKILALGPFGELKAKYQSEENLEHMFMRLVEKEEAPKNRP